MFGEVLVQSFLLDAGTELAKGWEMDSTLRVGDLEGVELALGDFFEIRGEVDRAEQSGNGITLENIGEEGEGFVSEAITSGKRIGI